MPLLRPTAASQSRRAANDVTREQCKENAAHKPPPLRFGTPSHDTARTPFENTPRSRLNSMTPPPKMRTTSATPPSSRAPSATPKASQAVVPKPAIQSRVGAAARTLPANAVTPRGRSQASSSVEGTRRFVNGSSLPNSRGPSASPEPTPHHIGAAAINGDSVAASSVFSPATAAQEERLEAVCAFATNFMRLDRLTTPPGTGSRVPAAYTAAPTPVADSTAVVSSEASPSETRLSTADGGQVVIHARSTTAARSQFQPEVDANEEDDDNVSATEKSDTGDSVNEDDDSGNATAESAQLEGRRSASAGWGLTTLIRSSCGRVLQSLGKISNRLSSRLSGRANTDDDDVRDAPGVGDHSAPTDEVAHEAMNIEDGVDDSSAAVPLSFLHEASSYMQIGRDDGAAAASSTADPQDAVQEVELGSQPPRKAEDDDDGAAVLPQALAHAMMEESQRRFAEEEEEIPLLAATQHTSSLQRLSSGMDAAEDHDQDADEEDRTPVTEAPLFNPKRFFDPYATPNPSDPSPWVAFPLPPVTHVSVPTRPSPRPPIKTPSTSNPRAMSPSQPLPRESLSMVMAEDTTLPLQQRDTSGDSEPDVDEHMLQTRQSTMLHAEDIGFAGHRASTQLVDEFDSRFERLRQSMQARLSDAAELEEFNNRFARVAGSVEMHREAVRRLTVQLLQEVEQPEGSASRSSAAAPAQFDNVRFSDMDTVQPSRQSFELVSHPRTNTVVDDDVDRVVGQKYVPIPALRVPDLRSRSKSQPTPGPLRGVQTPPPAMYSSLPPPSGLLPPMLDGVSRGIRFPATDSAPDSPSSEGRLTAIVTKWSTSPAPPLQREPQRQPRPSATPLPLSMSAEPTLAERVAARHAERVPVDYTLWETIVDRDLRATAKPRRSTHHRRRDHATQTPTPPRPTPHSGGRRAASYQ